MRQERGVRWAGDRNCAGGCNKPFWSFLTDNCDPKLGTKQKILLLFHFHFSQKGKTQVSEMENKTFFFPKKEPLNPPIAVQFLLEKLAGRQGCFLDLELREMKK